MKRFALLILAAATSVTACLKEQGTDVSVDASSGKGLVISAESVPLTKTDIDKGKSTWEYGDSIAVLYDGRKYIYKTLQSGDQVIFTCANGIDEYDESKGIIAYYPPVSLDEVVGVSAEPEISFYGEEQINASKAPLVGTAEGSMSQDKVLKMSFKNICSIMELRINPEAVSDGIKTLRVEPASTTGYEGYLTFTGTVDLATLAITTATTGNVITLNLPENTSLDRPLTLKFPVGRFKSPSGLKLTVEGLDGKKMSRIVYATGVESYTEESGIYSVKHLAKPLYPFVLTAPEAVDLGLSVLWASCNLGATAPEEYGDYYAWGETETKEEYSWTNYKWSNGSGSTLTKYNNNSSYGTVDNKTQLEVGPEGDDVASKKLGGKWRMPSDDDWKELWDNCSWTYTTNYNGTEVTGLIVTSNVPGYADKSIFFPAAGYLYETTFYGAGLGYYWSSSLNTDKPNYAWRGYFRSDAVDRYYNIRCRGHVVRPVYGDTSNIPVASVSVVPTSLLVEIGKSASLTATIRPANATDQVVTWSSSDSSIATVDQSGNVTGVNDGTATIIASCGGRSTPCSVMVKQTMPSGQIDLGLSVKWASCNVGASSPEGYGDYYAWGETETKDAYNWTTYKWGTSKTTLTKYNTNSSNGTVDNLSVLQMVDDAANVKLGDMWRIATPTEFNELRDNCTSVWTNYNGVDGRMFCSNKSGFTDKWIFLPAAGDKANSDLVNAGVKGYYWSSSFDTENNRPWAGWGVCFVSNNIVMGDYSGRYYGFPIRPVYGEIPVSSVSVDPTTLKLFVGASKTLTAQVLPSNATTPSFTWSSSKSSVATVNQNGKVTAVAKGTATITVKTVDGGYTATCTVTVANPVPTGAVDLGLSVYWAKSNLSTSGLCANPQDYGGYYAWGETAPKSSYNWSTYKWCNGSNTSLTRYCPSGKTSYWGGSGSPDNKTSFKDYNYADDAARKVLGSNWRMPTKTEWAELQNNCTWTWTTRDGVYGRLVTASNGNSIFLPAAGYRSDSSLSSAGSYGYYWTSSLDTGSPNSAWRAYFKSSAVSGGNVGRYMGFSVRPVSE